MIRWYKAQDPIKPRSELKGLVYKSCYFKTHQGGMMGATNGDIQENNILLQLLCKEKCNIAFLFHNIYQQNKVGFWQG